MYRATLIALLLSSVQGFGAWSYDWSTRTDRCGNTNGHFATTPYPITDASTVYSITNDEGVVEFQLGTLYFVDGAMADDTGDGLSLLTAKKTIAAAITVAGDGNNTVLIRGAHDAFDGIYNISSALIPKAGTGPTNRFSLIGYEQERPTLDMGNAEVMGIRRTTNAAVYFTAQRLKFQNSKDPGVQMGNNPRTDAYVNLIDLWVTNCTSTVNNPAYGDGNIYLYNMEYGWVYHCTSEHTTGHGIKCGDTLGGRTNTIEWNVVRECGWWDGGFQTNASWGSHPAGIDCPADPGQSNVLYTIRYNTVNTTLNYGIYCRRTAGFSIHHNETFDNIHFDEISGQEAISTARAQLLIEYTPSAGNIYNNLIRDPGNTGTWAIDVRNTTAAAGPLQVWNNLVYGQYGVGGAVKLASSTTQEIDLYNNTLVTSNTLAVVRNQNATDTTLLNNIVYQLSTGPCVSRYTAVPVTQTNIFYYPSGSLGITLGTGDVNIDPELDADYTLLTNSPAIGNAADLSALFTTDFAGGTRTNWDIGAYAANAEEGGGGGTAPTISSIDFTEGRLLCDLSFWTDFPSYSGADCNGVSYTNASLATFHHAFTFTNLAPNTAYAVTLYASDGLTPTNCSGGSFTTQRRAVFGTTVNVGTMQPAP